MTLVEFFEVARKLSEAEVKHRDELARLEADHRDQLARQAAEYKAAIEALEGRCDRLARINETIVKDNQKLVAQFNEYQPGEAEKHCTAMGKAEALRLISAVRLPWNARITIEIP